MPMMPKLANALLGSNTQSSPSRQMLAQYLMQQSMINPRNSGSFGESANIAMKPIMATMLANRESQAQRSEADKLRGQLSSVLGSNPQLAKLLASAPPETLRGIQESLFSKALNPDEGFSLGPGHGRYDANGNLIAERGGGTATGADPAQVREHEYFLELGRKDRERNPSLPADKMTPGQLLFIERRRSASFQDIMGVPTNLNDPSNPRTYSTQAGEIDAAASREREVTEARKEAEARTEAQVRLPENLFAVNKFRTEIQGLLDDKGFNSIYGMSRYISPRMIPGQAGADAEGRRLQLEGSSFSIAIERMVGLGQLSDAEGRKITAAYTRAINPRISEGSARQAWNEVLGYLDATEINLREKAGQGAEAEGEEYKEGDVVVNPQSGERLVLRNNQWVPE